MLSGVAKKKATVKATINPPKARPASPAGPVPLPPPPVGTYDPTIDYNAGASQRGYGYSADDAATAYANGQEDYGLAVQGLTTGRDRSLADLLTGHTRSDQDYSTATQDLGHQYSILGNTQAQAAARQGILSGGLLAQSAAARSANQTHDQTGLDTQHNRATEDYNSGVTRTNQDFTTGKTALDLSNARTYGGYGGNILNDPLTGQPITGTLATGLARAGIENNAYQFSSGQQRDQQAQQFGYIAPPPPPAPHAAASITGTTKRKTRTLTATAAHPYASVRTP